MIGHHDCKTGDRVRVVFVVGETDYFQGLVRESNALGLVLEKLEHLDRGDDDVDFSRVWIPAQHILYVLHVVEKAR